jgi:hypothetical protein
LFFVFFFTVNLFVHFFDLIHFLFFFLLPKFFKSSWQFFCYFQLWELFSHLIVKVCFPYFKFFKFFFPLFFILNYFVLFVKFIANKIIDFFYEQLLLTFNFRTFFLLFLNPFSEFFTLIFTDNNFFVFNLLINLFRL